MADEIDQFEDEADFEKAFGVALLREEHPDAVLEHIHRALARRG